MNCRGTAEEWNRRAGGIDWLRENGVEVIDLRDEECIAMLGDYIHTHPEIWNEKIGQ